MEIAVPKNFHGEVKVTCTSTGKATRHLQTDEQGSVDASCPSIQATIRILRDGQPVQIAGSPIWKAKRDGDMESIQIVVP